MRCRMAVVRWKEMAGMALRRGVRAWEGEGGERDGEGAEVGYEDYVEFLREEYRFSEIDAVGESEVGGGADEVGICGR